MRQLTARDMDQVIKSCKRVFSRMDELMSRPLLDYRWRYLKAGSYYKGWTENGKFVKLPKRRFLEMALLPNGKEVEISTSREKSEEITRETDGKPIPRESLVRRYKLFGSVRSMRHIREGHLVELDALKLYLKIVISDHYRIDKHRRELSDEEVEEFKEKIKQLLDRAGKWESAYKILGRFKLEDALDFLEQAKANPSRFSIGLTKIASLLERVAKWRPRQMNNADRRSYMRECVLRYQRDAQLKSWLYMLSNGIQGRNGTEKMEKLNKDLELSRICGQALLLLNGKGRKPWDEIRKAIVGIGTRLSDADLKYSLRIAYSRIDDPSKGRVPEIRRALERTGWILESGHPLYFATELQKTRDSYMDEVVALLFEGADAIEGRRVMDSFRALREAQNLIKD